MTTKLTTTQLKKLYTQIAEPETTLHKAIKHHIIETHNLKPTRWPTHQNHYEPNTTTYTNQKETLQIHTTITDTTLTIYNPRKRTTTTIDLTHPNSIDTINTTIRKITTPTPLQKTIHLTLYPTITLITTAILIITTIHDALKPKKNRTMPQPRPSTRSQPPK